VAAGLRDQIERHLQHIMRERSSKPYRINRSSKAWDKKVKHRTERRRAKLDPECITAYRRYSGWEY